MNCNFTEEKRKIIKEAIEDHRSSNNKKVRSKYGELVSSADRNTSIEMVFRRSFLRAQREKKDMSIEEYLEYTFNRLSKRYGYENPENMFLEDEIYKVFLNDMRKLLKNEIKFKNYYCKVNNINDRFKNVGDYEN